MIRGPAPANKRTGAREKTLFPNEASNFQLGAQFAAVAGFVLDRAREKGLGRDLPSEWFAHGLRQTFGPARKARGPRLLSLRWLGM